MKHVCKIGVQLPEVERLVEWPELIAMARAAEAVGFDSIWLGDHCSTTFLMAHARAVGGGSLVAPLP